MFLRAMISATIVAAMLAATAAADDPVDFEKQILPIFMEHCTECHGETRRLGRMRLHTAAALQEKWDAAEKLILAGEPEQSELYERLVLPADDNKRMPKDADPLPQEKIDLIANWIKQGAVLPAATADPVEPPGDEPPAVDTDETEEAATEAEPEAPAELPLPEVAAAPQEAIDRLSAAGATVLPLYAQSNLLQISFPGRSEPVGDAEVALLTDVAEQVHMLNLAGAEVSAGGLAPLAQCKNLAALHLERSNISDEALAHLSGLERLQYLNLYGTRITDAGLEYLTSLKHLRRLYLWQTEASYDAAMALESEIPGLVVNLGFDHPVVVRVRLTKELEVAQQRAEDAKAAEEQARQQHEAAQKELETTTARLTEIEQQLKELEEPQAATADQADPSQASDEASSTSATE